MAAGVMLGARLTAKPLLAGLADWVLGARLAFGLGGMAGHLATEDSLNGRAGPGLVVCFGGLGCLLVSGTGVALYVRGAELATGGAGTATWIWGAGMAIWIQGDTLPKRGEHWPLG